MTNMCRLRSMVFGTSYRNILRRILFKIHYLWQNEKKKNILVDLHHDFLVSYMYHRIQMYQRGDF